MIYLSFLWHCPPHTFMTEEDPRIIATARKLVREMNEKAEREQQRWH